MSTNITEQDVTAFLVDALQSLNRPGHLMASAVNNYGGPARTDFSFYPEGNGESFTAGSLDELRAKNAEMTPEKIRARKLAEARELVAKLEAEMVTP